MSHNENARLTPKIWRLKSKWNASRFGVMQAQESFVSCARTIGADTDIARGMKTLSRCGYISSQSKCAPDRLSRCAIIMRMSHRKELRFDPCHIELKIRRHSGYAVYIGAPIIRGLTQKIQVVQPGHERLEATKYGALIWKSLQSDRSLQEA
jgi:hypothetical protein